MEGGGHGGGGLGGKVGEARKMWLMTSCQLEVLPILGRFSFPARVHCWMDAYTWNASFT